MNGWVPFMDTMIAQWFDRRREKRNARSRRKRKAAVRRYIEGAMNARKT